MAKSKPTWDDDVPDKTGGREAKKGFAFMKAPSNVTSCSFDGVEYPSDDDGVVEVPAEGVRPLAEHGFVAL